MEWDERDFPQSLCIGIFSNAVFVTEFNRPTMPVGTKLYSSTDTCVHLFRVRIGFFRLFFFIFDPANRKYRTTSVRKRFLKGVSVQKRFRPDSVPRNKR